MTTRQLNEADYFKAWAIFWLAATIGGFIVGAVGGGILGGVLGGARVAVQTIKLVCGVFGFLLSIPLSYVLFRFTVAKFIVSKLSAQNDSAPPSVPTA